MCLINAISFPYWFSLCRRIEVGIQVPCSGPKADRRRSWVRISLGPRLEHSHCSPSSEWVPEVASFICRYQRHDGTPPLSPIAPYGQATGASPILHFAIPHPFSVRQKMGRVWQNVELDWSLFGQAVDTFAFSFPYFKTAKIVQSLSLNSKLAFVAAQSGLCWTWSETPQTGFLLRSF